MAELTNGKDAQGHLVDPMTLARLTGGSPDYIGTILIGQTRYNADGLRRLIDIANLGIGIDDASRDEWIITACLELGGNYAGMNLGDLIMWDEDDDDYDEAQELSDASPNLQAQGLPYGAAPIDAGNLWRREQKLRDPITGLGFTETQAGIIYDHLHRGDEAAPAAAAEERHKGGARTRRKRRTAGRGGTNMAGYNANNQMDNEEERRLDMMERMERVQKRNALQRYKEHIAIPGQIDKPGHGGNTHKNKQYSRIGKLGGNTPKSKTRKSKTRKSKTRKSKTPKKSKTRKSRLGPPPSTVPPPPPIIKCSAFNTEKRDHKKMLDKEEKKRKKSRVSRKKRQEKKRVKDMTERVVCEVRRMFSKRTPSPYDFEKEMREWLEREETKRRRRRTRRRKGGRRRKKRGSRRKRRRTLRGGVWKNWHDSSKEIEEIEKKQDPKAHKKIYVGKPPAEEGIHFHGARNNSWLRFKIAGKHYDLIESERLSLEQCHKAKAAAAEHAPWAVLMIDDIMMNWSGLVKELYQGDSDSEQEISLHGLFNHIGEENQDNLEEIKKREEEREKKKAQNQKLEEAIKQERLAAENRDKRLLARAGNTAGSSDARYLAHVQFARENKNRVKLVGLTKNNTKHNGKIVRIREVLKNGNFKVSFEGKHSAQGGGAVKTWEVKRQNLSPIISKSDHDKKQSYPRMPPVLVPERTGDGGWRISVRDVEEYIRNLNAHVLRYGRPPTKKIKSRLKLGTEVKALRWNKQTEQFELNILSNSPPKSKKGKKKGRRAQQHAAQPARGPPLGASGPCPGCGTMLRPPRGVREFVCSVCGVELFLEA